MALDYLPNMALNPIADAAAALVRDRLPKEMRLSGENPDDPELYALRLSQMSIGIALDLNREWEARHRL